MELVGLEIIGLIQLILMQALVKVMQLVPPQQAQKQKSRLYLIIL
jgi:hypothetical protein